MVGNDEQYAAIMALLANKVGVPARVVLGAVVPEDGVVDGATCRPGSSSRSPTAPGGCCRPSVHGPRPPAEQPPPAEQEMSGTVVPPPAPDPAAVDRRRAERRRARGPQGGPSTTTQAAEDDSCPAGWLAVLVYVGGPLLLAALLSRRSCVAKALRRRRRRAAEGLGPDRRRLARAGRPRPRPRPAGAGRAGGTRREQSAVASAAAPGPGPARPTVTCSGRRPAPGDAAAYWARSTPSARRCPPVSRRPRLRAALNLTTFRRGAGSRLGPGRARLGICPARPRLACRPNVGRVSRCLAAARNTPDPSRSRVSACARDEGAPAPPRGPPGRSAQAGRFAGRR